MKKDLVIWQIFLLFIRVRFQRSFVLRWAGLPQTMDLFVCILRGVEETPPAGNRPITNLMGWLYARRIPN